MEHVFIQSILFVCHKTLQWCAFQLIELFWKIWRKAIFMIWSIYNIPVNKWVETVTEAEFFWNCVKESFSRESTTPHCCLKPSSFVGWDSFYSYSSVKFRFRRKPHQIILLKNWFKKVKAQTSISKLNTWLTLQAEK